jgi:putative endonuclease
MLTEAFVYIASSRSRCIYIGVTRNMPRRWRQHREGLGSAFVRKYRIRRLVYVERSDRLADAIAREKQLKGWRRSKKVALIETLNPQWDDLGEVWGWRDPIASRGTRPAKYPPHPERSSPSSRSQRGTSSIVTTGASVATIGEVPRCARDEEVTKP